MMLFPHSRVKEFRHTNKALRYGQQFYDYMKLDKVKNPQDKAFCDKIYIADTEEKAKALINSRIDYNA